MIRALFASTSRFRRASATSAPHTRLAGARLWVARALWLLVLLLVGGILLANLPHLVPDTRAEWQVRQAAPAAISLFATISAFVRYLVSLKLVAITVFTGTALFLAWRQPDDWMVLYTSATLLLLQILFGLSIDVETVRYPQLLERVLPAIRVLVPTVMVTTLIGFFFLFPSGRLHRRWHLGVILLAVALSALFFYGATNPVYRTPAFSGRLPEEWGWHLFIYSLLGTLTIGLASRLRYYRTVAPAQKRQQTKLVLFGLAILLVVPLGQSVLGPLLPLSYSWRHFIYLHTALLFPLILPLTIGMSVLRYRLWQVDLLINRTLVFAALTVLVSAIYIVVVGVLGALSGVGQPVAGDTGDRAGGDPRPPAAEAAAGGSQQADVWRARRPGDRPRADGTAAGGSGAARGNSFPAGGDDCPGAPPAVRGD